MSKIGNHGPALSLRMREQAAEEYRWVTSGVGRSSVFSDLPFFELTPQRLSHQLTAASQRQQLSLDFRPGDCETTAGLRNCTEVCSDPTALFTPQNLPACVLLASAALLIQNETYTVDRSDATTLRTIEAWHVPELITYNATGVLTNLAKCVSESCAVSTLGECKDDVRTMDGVRIIADNLAGISARLALYCSGMKPVISPDIAGPGVSLSYFFQGGFALLFFVVTKLLSTWTRGAVALFRRCGGSPQLLRQGGRLESRLASSKPGAAIISSVVEFQEVQTYFVAVVEIATLISFNSANPGADSSNQNSFSGAILNSMVVSDIAICSVFGPLLTQCCLQRAGMHWWYTFILTSVTYVLALTIFLRNPSLLPPTDGLWTSFKATAPLPQCGSNPSPMTYCVLPYGTSFTFEGSGASIALAAFGTLAWWTLLIDQLAFSIREKLPHVARRLSSLDRTGIFRRVLKSRAWPWMLSLYWGLVQGLLIYWGFAYLNRLVYLVGGTGIDNAANWSFGQFIAVTVWAPTIIKFIYFNIFGVKEGFEERISKDYRIIRNTEASEAPEALPLYKYSVDARHASTYPFFGHEGMPSLPASQGS